MGTASEALSQIHTIQLARGEVNEISILQGKNGVGLVGTFALDDSTLLLQVDCEGFFLSFVVLDDELKDTIDLLSHTLVTIWLLHMLFYCNCKLLTCLRSLAFWSAGRASKEDLMVAKISELWKPGTLMSDMLWS